MLPAGSPVERCLFWIAREASPTIRGVMKRVPEPAIEHVAEGMALARHIANIAAHASRLAELLRPEECVPFEPVYFGRYNMGFHTAAHDEVRAAMLDAGARLLPVDEVLGGVAVLHLRDAGGAEIHEPITLRWIRDNGLGFRVIEPTAPGLFTLEIPGEPVTELALFLPGAGLDLQPPRGGEVLELEFHEEASVEIVASPVEVPWSIQDQEAAVAVVSEVHATPLVFRRFGARFELALAARAGEGRLEVTLEVRRDGVVDKTMTESVPAFGPFDRARWTALVRGVRTAVAALHDLESLTPSDLLPTDLMVALELDSDAKFARRAFDLLPIARVAAPVEAGPVLARHGFGDIEARHVVDLWLLLPQTLLSRRRVGALRWTSVEAAAKRLVASDATAVLEILVEEWTTTMVRARADALDVMPLYERIDTLLYETLGVHRMVAARRRALRRRRT